MKKLCSILFIIILSGLSLIQAQSNYACHYYKKGLVTIVPTTQFSTNDEARSIVNDICKATNYNSPLIIRSGNVDNACATTDLSGQKLILYNPQFIRNIDYRTQTNWGAVSILAHEIGHHYYGIRGYSTNVAKNHQQELEADYYSGYALAKLGATLEQSQIAIQNISSDSDGETHPAKNRRLKAIEDGWGKSGGQKMKTKVEEPIYQNEDDEPDVIVTERTVRQPINIPNDDVYRTPQQERFPSRTSVKKRVRQPIDIWSIINAQTPKRIVIIQPRRVHPPQRVFYRTRSR
jgi:hypothetical protein